MKDHKISFYLPQNLLSQQPFSLPQPLQAPSPVAVCPTVVSSLSLFPPSELLPETSPRSSLLKNGTELNSIMGSGSKPFISLLHLSPPFPSLLHPSPLSPPCFTPHHSTPSCFTPHHSSSFPFHPSLLLTIMLLFEGSPFLYFLLHLSNSCCKFLFEFVLRLPDRIQLNSG